MKLLQRIVFCFILLFVGSALSAQQPKFEIIESVIVGGRVTMPNAWADFDNDGDLDLFIGFRKDLPNRLYRNDGGHFTDIAAKVGVADTAGTWAVAWGDYNADGLLDLYVGFKASSSKNRITNKLYRNDGSNFTDVASSVGLVLPFGTSRQANWIDFDNDGDVDLFVGFRFEPNKLFRNDNGKFIDITEEMGITGARATMSCVWFDFDMDGDLDLYVANMDGHANRLYRNDRTRFVDVAPQFGLDGGGRDISPCPGVLHSTGGISPYLVDYDNDGDFDLFVTNLGGPDGFYRNNGGSFVNVAPELGLAHQGYRGTAAWADFNNDGWIDLFVNGTLYRNDKGIFKNVTPETIQKNVGGYGKIWADFDGDGAMDLTISSNNYPLIRNLLPSKQASNCLKVMVLDANGHHSRAGTEIRLFSSSSKKLIGARIVETGSGYSAQSVMPEHFGLPKKERVDVEITSMTNNGRKTARLNNIDPKKYAGSHLVIKVDIKGNIVK